MAKFDNLTITNNGLDMIALSQSGAKLIFTKIKLGDGQIGDNDVMKLTDIINERMTSQISSIEAKGNGQIAIKFTVDNSELTSGFFVREIGIFAKINETGEEKLYAYTNAGNYTNYLADNKTPVDAIIIKIDLAVGNATDINFTIDKSIVYVSLEDLDTAIKNHGNSPTTHTEAFEKHNDNEASHEPAFNKHNADINAHKSLFDKKLNKEGDTLTGALNFANNTPNQVGDDCYIGDADKKGAFCVMSTDSSVDTGIALLKKQQDWKASSDYATINYDGTNVNISKPLTGTLNMENIKDASQNKPILRTLLRYQGNIPYQTDLNNYITQGMYMWNNTTINSPVANSFGTIFVLCNTEKGVYEPFEGAWIHQLAFTTGNKECYLRSKINEGDWSDWHQIPTADSPIFTGTPQAPTPALGNNSQQIANTSWVNQTIDNLEAEWVVLMDTWINTGDIKLSESWRNFDEIIVWTTYDDKNIVCVPSILPSVLLKAFFDDGVAAYWDIFTGGSYWRIARAGSTDTLWKLNGESVGIRRIYGVRKKKISTN